jgi:hypothetical protein
MRSVYLKKFTYYLELFLYSNIEMFSKLVLGRSIMKMPIRRTELIYEVRSSNRLYYETIPKTSLEKAKKLRDLGVSSVENLTNSQINNLENKLRFGKRYIPQESLDNILEDGSFTIHELKEYSGVIPERVLDSIKIELDGVFSIYKKNSIGEYNIIQNKDNLNPTHFMFRGGFEKTHKLMRRDFILVKKDIVGFEDFKNNSDVNKCEQALYLTELFGGYRIIESW